MRKKGFKSYVLIFLSLILIFSMNVTSYANTSEGSKTIRIEVSALNFRTSPWGSVMGVVTDGNTYKVYGSKKDSSGNVWYKIKSGSKYGYVYAGNGYTKVVSKSASSETKVNKKVRIQVSALNFRTSPWGKVIGVVTSGNVYRVYASKKDSNGKIWYKIKSRSKYGYVYAGNGYTKEVSSNKKTVKSINKKVSKETKINKRVSIQVSALNFRTSPWGKVIGVVTRGSTYQVYAYKKDANGKVWYKIKSRSKYGYIYAGNGYTKEVSNKKTAVKNQKKTVVKSQKKKAVKSSAKQTSKKSKTTNKRIRIDVSALNVRTSPWGKVIGVASRNTTFKVISSTKDSHGKVWYKIKHGSKYGYIYAGNGYTKEVSYKRSSSGAFKPRFTAPSRYSKYYTTDNVFYIHGYGMPNCTCYAWGRAYEILGYKPTWLSRWDAYTFYDDNYQNFPYGRGQQIRVGAIACWGGNSYGSSGHVAVVEKIHSDGRVTISQSSYHGGYFDVSTYDSAKDLENAMGGNFKGYVYLR